MSALGLQDELPYGKYEGEDIQSVIDADPSYMIWAAEEAAFDFDIEVLEILGRLNGA